MSHSSAQSINLLVVASAVFGSVTVSAFAQELDWEFNPRLSFSQVFSDNIGLDPVGEEESEFVSQLNTGFNFSRQGGSARARVGYNLQSLLYWQDTTEDRLFHQFFADGGVELLPERLSIDSSAGFTQRQLTGERAGGDNLTRDSNRTDVLTFRVSPVYTERLDDLAEVLFRYSYNRVEILDSSADDSSSERNSVNLDITSGTRFSRFGWGLSFAWSQTDFDDGSFSSLPRIDALGRWNVTDRFSLFGTIGYEENEFEQGGARSQQDGLTWRLGSTFAPGERTFMEAFVGDRVFGTTYGASLRHRLRNSQVLLDYREEITTVNEFESDQTIPRGVNATIEEALIVDGEPVFLDLESPELRSGAFVSRRLSVAYTGERRKTGWGIRLFHEERDFEISNRTEQAQSIAGNLSWRVRPRTSLFADGSLQQRDSGGVDGDQTLYFTRFGLQRQLGPRLNASLSYSFRELDGSNGENDYQENRVTATVQRSF
ncbi:MAG: TIGR03016 family PEP-CTERM system-associated outer membrane protein [Gammaproteobacteria bacterium]|jgi:uncharacterized protein (PEP-CTERM system associated)|nr:TIGR03016 family PEP-CTERM system-associated outer membrane protein [Gammaproteobacteria bacterium]